jgi:hypothetical protein
MNAKLLFGCAALIGIAAAQIGLGNPRGYFRIMEIDPRTRAVTLQDAIPGTTRPSGEFFAPFTNQTGDYTVDHFDGKQRFNAFWVSHSGFLSYRTKIQELVRGPFGSVYSWSNCYYSESGAHAITFHVRAYANAVPHELPQVVSALPKDHDLQLDAISIIRVFPVGPGFIVVSGQYSPEGLLDDVILDGARGGDWIHQNKIDELDKSLGANVVRSDDYLRYQKRFGLPGKLRIADLSTGASLWGEADRPSSLTIVNLHYDRNRWVRQDSITSSGVRNTRFLSYRTTAQDRSLDTIDRQLIFRPAVSRR